MSETFEDLIGALAPEQQAEVLQYLEELSSDEFLLERVQSIVAEIRRRPGGESEKYRKRGERHRRMPLGAGLAKSNVSDRSSQGKSS